MHRQVAVIFNDSTPDTTPYRPPGTTDQLDRRVTYS